MDTGNGKFKELTDKSDKYLEEIRKENPNHGGVFMVGETIEIRGSIFKIQSLKDNQMRLKLQRRKGGPNTLLEVMVKCGICGKNNALICTECSSDVHMRA